MSISAYQSATMQDILVAVRTVLVNGDGECPATGVNEQYIVQTYMNYRPRSAEPYEITFALLEERPYMYAGAGRKGQDTFFTLVIQIYTRYESDPAGADDDWALSTEYGALVMRNLVDDLLCGKFLFGNYDPTTHAPIDNPLTIEPLQPLPNPAPDKPNVGDNSNGEDTGGYGRVTLRYSVKSVKPLTVPEPD